MEFIHYSVLLSEATDMLNIKENGIYVDCTFGGGGHTSRILEKLDGWHRILYRSEDGIVVEGYVSASYVTVDTVAGTVTDAESGLNVRAGAGTDFEAQFKLKNGSNVVVAEQLDGWYRIWYLNDEAQITSGFVSADYITLTE